jgi:hypothetical protein
MIALVRTIVIDGALRLAAVEDQRTAEQTARSQSEERLRENRPYQLSHLKRCITQFDLIQS